MEKTIKIDDKLVKFKATANTPRMYRQQFQADLFVDIQNLNDAWQKARANKEPLPGDALVMFENIAFTMAKQADPEAVPDTADEWLEQFDMFSIWQILPEIIQLWGINTLSINESKKKAGKRKGNAR